MNNKITQITKKFKDNAQLELPSILKLQFSLEKNYVDSYSESTYYLIIQRNFIREYFNNLRDDDTLLLNNKKNEIVYEFPQINEHNFNSNISKIWNQEYEFIIEELSKDFPNFSLILEFRDKFNIYLNKLISIYYMKFNLNTILQAAKSLETNQKPFETNQKPFETNQKPLGTHILKRKHIPIRCKRLNCDTKSLPREDGFCSDICKICYDASNGADYEGRNKRKKIIE